MSETKKVSVNFPFLGILTLIFITLKLTGHITWSWWWVLSPLWIPVSIIIIIASLITAFIMILGTDALKIKEKK
jgi:hypothetical protein